jgi:hypothetical protein
MTIVIGLAKHDVRGEMKNRSSASELDSGVVGFNLSRPLSSRPRKTG